MPTPNSSRRSHPTRSVDETSALDRVCSSTSPRTLASDSGRYVLMEARRGAQRPPVHLQDDLTTRLREEHVRKWSTRVDDALKLKALPKPPTLISKCIFFEDSYRHFVRGKLCRNVQQERMKIQENTRRHQESSDDTMNDVVEGSPIHGDDVREFQCQWLIIVKLAAFLRMHVLARQHAALQNLRRLLAPKIRAIYARKRRISREKIVVAMFLSSMKPITVEKMHQMVLFNHFTTEELQALEPQWTPCCFIDEFILDERSVGDLFILDQGEVVVTKRRVPTLDVLAQMMTTRKYWANHEATWVRSEAHYSTASTSSHYPHNESEDGEEPWLSSVAPQSLEMEPGTLPAPQLKVLAALTGGSTKRSGADSSASGSEQQNGGHHEDTLASPHTRPKTLPELLRENCDVIDRLRARGSPIGLLSVMEGEPNFVGFRAATGKRCLLWRLPRRAVTDLIQKRSAQVLFEPIRTLRLHQLTKALPPTPQSLRNCDINIVFRHWTDMALEEIIRVLKPMSYLPEEVILDSSSPSPDKAAIVVFIARGVATLRITSSHSFAAIHSEPTKLPQPPGRHTSLAGGGTHLPHTRSNAAAMSTQRSFAGKKPPTTNPSLAAATTVPSHPSLVGVTETTSGKGAGAVDPMALSSSNLHSNTSPTSSTAPPSSYRPQELSDLISVTKTECIGPWQCFGDISALVTERRSTVITAAGKVDAWVCSKDQFSSIIQSHPALLLDALQNIRELRSAEVGRRGHGMLRVLLSGDPLLKSCSEKLLDELIAHASPFWIPPHEFLCGRDASSYPSLMVILDGSAYAQRNAGGTNSFGGGAGGDNVPDAVTNALSSQISAGTILNTAAMILEHSWVHSYSIRSRTVLEGFEIHTDAFFKAVEKTFGKREDAAKAFLLKIREACALEASSSSHVPMVHVKI